MLKACWLVCQCSYVPALFPFVLCLRPSPVFSSVSSFLFLYWFQPRFSLLSLSFVLQILLQGMKQRPKGSPYWFWLLITLRKLNLFHRFLYFLLSASFLSVFLFLSFTVTKGSKKETLCFPLICIILSFCCLFFFLLSPFPAFFFFFFLLFLSFFSLPPLGQQRRLTYSLYAAPFRKQTTLIQDTIPGYNQLKQIRKTDYSD